MFDKPIVSRLKVNLNWKAWFKALVVHPSVSAAAAENMQFIRYVEREQRAQEDKARIKNLAKELQKLGCQYPQISDISTNEIAEQISLSCAEIWKKVNKEQSAKTRIQFRNCFKRLEDPELSALIDLANLIERFNQPALIADFNQLIAKSSFDLNDNYLGSIKALLDSSSKNKAIQSAYARLERAANNSQWPIVDEIEQVVSPYVHPSHIIQGAYLKTYGFDGFEPTSTELTDAKGETYSFDQETDDSECPRIPFSLALMTFLGFPTRLHGKTKLGFREMLRNLFGGWDSLNNGRSTGWFWWLNPYNYTLEGKRGWNLLFLTLMPIKWIIFALKILSIPFKLTLNVLKIFTEFLPEVVLNYTGYLLGRFSSTLLRLHSIEQARNSKKIVWTIVSPFLFIVLIPLHLAARCLSLLGTAFSSPEKSARMAWNYGRSLNSRWGYVFAFLGATLSITLTATLWTIALPLVLTEAIALIPALATVLSTLAQFPLMASALGTINSAAVFVSATVPAAFTVVSTLISSAFGVAVSASTIAMAATVLFIAAPLASLLSRVADALSKHWVKWSVESTKNDVPEVLLEVEPSSEIRLLVSEKESSLNALEQSSQSVSKHAENKPYQAQIEEEASKGIPLDEPEPTLALQ